MLETYHRQKCSDGRCMAKISEVKVWNLNQQILVYGFVVVAKHNVLISANEENSMFIIAKDSL